ncbi:MAG: 50S ribosomal protein L6 [Lentisphaeria bacterium]
MSRLGKRPIDLAEEVKVEAKKGKVTVTGPKGELSYQLPACVTIKQEESKLVVSCKGFERSPDKRAKYGLARSLLQNMVTGVTKGFKKELQIQGVGYRGQCSGQKLSLNLGYSHPVEYQVPDGVAVSMPQNTQIVVEGIDRQLVGQVAATIRGFRPPDIYKGKGVRYAGEEVILKEGKTIA